MDSLTKFIKVQFKKMPTDDEDGETEGAEQEEREPGKKEEEGQVCHLSKASKLGQATVKMATCPPEANMTVEAIVDTTEDFYLGLGFEPMTPGFRNNSMFRRPSDGRTVNCHATAWDFSNGKVRMQYSEAWFCS